MPKILIDNDTLRRQARISAQVQYRKYVSEQGELGVPTDEELQQEAATQACARLGVAGFTVGERAVFDGAWQRYVDASGTIQEHRAQRRQMPRSVA